MANNFVPFQELTSLMQLLGGGKSTTITAQSSTANNSGLEQVLAAQLAQAQNPQLLQAIFSEGARAVPELTAAYANAAGGRSAKNSGLALALRDLNTNLAVAAQNAQQAGLRDAGNTAANLANSTRQGTTTVQQKAGNAGGMGKLLAAGTALSQLQKLGVLDKIKNAVGGTLSSANPAVGDIPLPQMVNLTGSPGAFEAIPNYNFDAANFDSVAPNGEIVDAFSNAFAPEVTSGVDAINGLDFGGEAVDLASSAFDTGAVDSLYDTVSGYSDIIPVEDAGSFFDFGGWFADGGVVRNRPNFGARPTVQRSTAQQLQSGTGTASQRRKLPGDASTVNLADLVAGGSAEAAPAAPVGPNNAAALGIALGQVSPLSALSFANNLANMNPLGLAISLGRFGMNVANIEGMLDNLDNTSLAQAQQALAESIANTPNAIADLGLASFGYSVAETAPTMSAEDMDTAAPPTGMEVGDLGSSSFSDSGGAVGSGGPGDAGSANGGDANGVGGDSSEGASTAADGGIFKRAKKPKSYADGGIIIGDSDSPDADDIPILATAGEAVLPVSVVQALGENNILNLIKRFHTPLKNGTNKG